MKKISRVCITTLEYPPDQWGGLARTAGNVSRHLRDMGMEVHVAHFQLTDEPFLLLDENRQDIVIDGILIHKLKAGREDISGRIQSIWDCPRTRTFKMMYQSLELLHREHQFDCFQSFFLYPTGYITGIMARKAERPSIVSIVGNDVKKYIFSPEKTAMCRSGLENADIVVALSRDLLDTAEALTPVKHKGRVIYNAVEVPDRAWKIHNGKGAFRIGCAGIFKYAKGLPYLFKAVASLRGRYDLTLELTGEIRESETKIHEEMLRRTGIQDILTFRPALPHKNIIDWLLDLDIFVLPSLSEGCPNILMEAMACGLPCVATDAGAVDILMEDGISGYIVPRGNSSALSDGIERIILRNDRGLSLGTAARERMKLFSPRREYDDWKGVYDEIAGRKKVC